MPRRFGLFAWRIPVGALRVAPRLFQAYWREHGQRGMVAVAR
jgi:hypothetical protein